MFPRFSFLLALVGGACLAASTGRAQLAAKSPFLPPQAANSPTATPGATLEFRGTMQTREGGLQVRIYDPAHKVGAWLKVNDRDGALDATIKQYDEAHNTVTLEHEGKTITLAQHESKIASSGMVQPMVAPVGMPAPQPPAQANMLPAVTQTVVPNPTPQQEQARLEAVAAEVARRRALREQAQQQLNQPQPAAAPAMRPGMQQVPGRIQQR